MTRIKTAYGLGLPLDDEAKKKHLRLTSKVSDLLSIRNPERDKFYEALAKLVARHERRRLRM